MHTISWSLSNITSNKEMHFSSRQFTLSGGKALSPVVRLVRLDYHSIGSFANITSNKISKSALMRCICPLVSLLCRLGKHFLHSYDSTTITLLSLSNITSIKFSMSPQRDEFLAICPFDGFLCRVDSYDSTTIISFKMRYICPLDSSLCRVNKHFLHWYDSTTITKGLFLIRQATRFLSPLSEIYLSTRQLHLSTRIKSTVLENPQFFNQTIGHLH